MQTEGRSGLGRIGLGCMRLSTERNRDEARGIAVLHAALDAGIRFFDTADAYCWDDGERGHNERLIARALSTWNGDRSQVHLATKGGLTRPDGRWDADGRAKHLVAACEDSRRALGVERIHLYQLHAPDPRVPLATSVRALAALKREGLVDAIGLCNARVGQIEQARRITEIDAIQVELSVWHDENLLSGVVEYCIAHRLRLLAFRPLGGPSRHQRTSADATLQQVAARHGATPFEIALAWLMTLSDLVVPIPGATRVETASSIARAPLVALTDADRAQLDQRFLGGHFLHRAPIARQQRTTDGTREIVLVMGVPGAGKSTYAEQLRSAGYHRLNRDEAGGTLRGLLPALDGAVAAGASRIVLDNTYVSRKARAEVLRAAATHDMPVRCVWLSTSVEDAQTNAVSRIVARYGRLPDEDELKTLRKQDVSAFLPMVQFKYQRELEPPDVSEGFASVEVIPFERQPGASSVNRAVLVWCDDVLLRSSAGHRVPNAPDDVVVLDERAGLLREYRDAGWHLLGLSWQPEIAEGKQSRAGADAVFARMNERLGVEIDVHYCPHPAGPPRCWCRKPLPGLGVLFVHRYHLDPGQCLYVGAGPQDPGFARRLGFQFREATAFFAR